MNEKPNDGGPAFPCETGGPSLIKVYPGMSLRDYFAGQVLPAVFESAVQHNFKRPTATTEAVWPVTVDEIAEKAYAVADAMLKARGR